MTNRHLHPLKEENIEFIRARLNLAQDLLEESDSLAGRDGYDLLNPDTNKDWWRHKRHEREALVIYLLLTCFDKLGQERRFLTHQDWLNSKQDEHVNQKNEVINELPPNASSIAIAQAFTDEYQKLFGIKNNFYGGIESLPDSQREKLLASIDIKFIDKYEQCTKNQSLPSAPLDDPALEERLKFQFIYSKRNQFTHQLIQYYQGSTPLAAENSSEPSWQAIVDNEEIQYLYAHQDIVKKGKGAYVYSTYWPFALFEILHSAIDSKFHRTDIDLRFKVQFWHKDFPSTIAELFLRHKDLKDVGKLTNDVWSCHKINSNPIDLRSRLIYKKFAMKIKNLRIF